MDADLTDQIFGFIARYIDQNGYPPSHREIAKACYLSRSGVVRHLDKLVEQGRVTREPHAARGIRIQRAPVTNP